MHHARAIFSKLDELQGKLVPSLQIISFNHQDWPTPVSQKTRKIPKSTKFEDALSELEAIVGTLEEGEQSLEASLEHFERGVSLSRFCQQSLSAAEQKVKILLADDDADAELETFESPDTAV